MRVSLGAPPPANPARVSGNHASRLAAAHFETGCKGVAFLPLTGSRRAIAFVLGSSGLFAVTSAMIKRAGAEVPTAELMLFRSGVALMLLLPWIVRSGGWTVLRTRYWRAHAFRAVTGLGGMFGTFYGYTKLPLATSTALGFAMPIFLALMGVAFLRERVGLARAATIGVGLVGVLLLIRPWEGRGGVPLFDTAVVMAGVLAWAGSMIGIRTLGLAGERNLTIVTWFMLSGLVASIVLCIPVWVTPRWGLLPLLLGMGVMSGTAQLLMTEGYRNGESSLLAPFEYSAILYTVVMGALFWGEVPGVWDAVGILVLIGSGLWTWRRESRAS